MFIGGLNWHPYIISGVTWNSAVHAVSCFDCLALPDELLSLQRPHSHMFNIPLLHDAATCLQVMYVSVKRHYRVPAY